MGARTGTHPLPGSRLPSSRTHLHISPDLSRSCACAPTCRLNHALQGRYIVERELGRGGMATVYLARDLRHDRSVALKVLHPELAASLGAERFLARSELTARLQHPHILPCSTRARPRRAALVQMPYVEGETSAPRLEREAQLPSRTPCGIIARVRRRAGLRPPPGVVHRDIKPENILLAGGQAAGRRLRDRPALDAAGRRRLTQTGSSWARPQYMSPEQATGERPSTAAATSTRWACVLYEMLAGEPPFTGPTAQSVVAKRFLEPTPHVRTLRGTVPETVELALLKSLEKLPADRFATGAEFAAALHQPASLSGAAERPPPEAAASPAPASRGSLRSGAASGAALPIWFIPWY